VWGEGRGAECQGLSWFLEEGGGGSRLVAMGWVLGCVLFFLVLQSGRGGERVVGGFLVARRLRGGVVELASSHFLSLQLQSSSSFSFDLFQLDNAGSSVRGSTDFGGSYLELGFGFGSVARSPTAFASVGWPDCTSLPRVFWMRRRNLGLGCCSNAGRPNMLLFFFATLIKNVARGSSYFRCELPIILF
jgi:hypothetical protein